MDFRPIGARERAQSTKQARLVSMFTAKGECLARRVRMANTLLSRSIGLLARSQLDGDEGLLLAPGGSIHTFGMRFPIDVIFLDAELRVRALSRRVHPWRISLAPPRTAFVLELPAGRIDEMKLDCSEPLVLRLHQADAPEPEKRKPAGWRVFSWH
jgi:uncharacterized membrane protein (UPF0127 family)